MTYGCLTIKFNKKMSEADIQKMVNGIFLGNQRKIDGMSFFQFDDESAITEIQTTIKNMDDVGSDKPTETKAEQMTLD